MKQVKSCLIFLYILLFNYCVTANINQPPVVVEKSTPYSYFKSGNSHPYLQDNTTEEEVFEELSKQDPFLKEDCKNCKPDNQAPGYIEETKPQKQEEVVVVTHTDYSSDSSIEEGIASWYGKDFDGRPTASGEIFDSRKLTGAHRTLPLGTIVSVKNLDNNKEVILKINDRGPHIKNRIIDVSEYAAELLDFKYKGLTRVRIQVLKHGDLKEKNEGATAIFFKSAEKESGSSPYETLIEDKKNQILNNVKSIEEFKYYSVQIGSFSDIKNIIRLKEELEKKIPYPVFVLKKNNEYVIRIGSFSERYPAEVLKLKLEEYGYKGYVANPI